MLWINYTKCVQILSPTFKATNLVGSDLLSYYKEVLDDDDAAYVARYAQLNGKTIEESVDALSEKIISITERVRKILGDGQAREAWENFASGFVRFNLFCPRYRWKEVVPEYF